MARSIKDIQNTITTQYVSEMAAIGRTVDPSNWSKTNVEQLIIFVFASAAFVLESLFDVLRSEVDTTISQLKPHSIRWYAAKAKLYQHGYALPSGSDVYDNTGISDADIAASKIVTYAAVVEQVNAYGRVSLRIKLATDDGNDLTSLSGAQLAGVKEYFQRVKDAGVALTIDSLPADNLKIQIEIAYDPLILNAQGARLDGTDSDPVGNTIREYLKNLPFNGTFVLAYLTDEMQSVDGVVIPTILGAQTKYGNRDYESVNVKYNPDAGYLRIYDDADLLITYTAQSAIK